MPRHPAPDHPVPGGATPGEAGPAEVVHAHLAAFGRGDVPALLATLADDADFRTGTTLVEPAGFAAFFGDAVRDLAPRVEITRLLADGPDVACEFTETVTLDGVRVPLQRAAFYRVTDGLVVRVQVYDRRTTPAESPLTPRPATTTPGHLVD